MIAEEFDYRLSPQEIALLLRGNRQLIWLDSAVTSGELGRYSYLMSGPSVELMVELADDGVPATTVRSEGRGSGARSETFHCDALELCALALDESRESSERNDLPPFRGGWAGFVGYDYGAMLEGVKAAGELTPTVPLLVMSWYDWVIAWDHSSQRAWAVVRESRPDPGSVFAAAAALASGERKSIKRTRTQSASLLLKVRKVIADAARGIDPLKRTERVTAEGGRNGTAESPQMTGVRSSFSRDEYMQAVQRVRELILAGDIFQANISQRFSTNTREDAWQLYERLREANPASMAAFMESDRAAILSSSPEMFLHASAAGAVESRPIKGTRPRGSDVDGDERLAAELLASRKDRSENLMIVDLLRNDLSRVCEPGSVFVPNLFELERMTTVQHLVSTVRGQLQSGMTAVDLFRACFPGGSITGAPKIRAMEIIAEIERVPRGVYCGAIGYFAADGEMLFNIAIRTMTLSSGAATFSAGGGIVLDSDPAAEYDETLSKAAGIMRALGATS